MDVHEIEEIAHEWVAMAVLSIEALAVIIILIAILYGTTRYLVHFFKRVPDSYEHYRAQLGKSLLLGLQLLVAADVVRTVALQPTMNSVMVLGLLVIVRTFLSWSTVVEIEGRWPWHSPSALDAPDPPRPD
jgi:uncharacterized membrane protein